jgi:LPS O-antigen subunit length determinant protein (WzzB/FepE family)
MSDTNSYQNEYHDEINLKELLKVLLDNKKIIFILIFLSSISSIVFSLVAEEKWVSTSLLTSASETGVGGSSQAGGIAAIAGINLSKNATSPTSKAMATIKSRDFFSHLLSFDGVLENIMAFQSYDKSSQKTIFNSDIYNLESKVWVNGLKPTDLQAYTLYRGMLGISSEKITNFITITVEHGSPIFAEQFLSLIIREVNELSRQRDLNQSKESLNYLYSQLETVVQSDVQLAVSQLIETQLKKQMMAKVKKNYILQPIDTPFIPELRHSPKRTQLVIIGTLMGIVFSIMFVIIRYYLLKSFDQH